MSATLEEIKKLAIDAGIDLDALIAEVVKEEAAAPRGPRKINLPGRKALKSGRNTCEAEPGTGLEWAGFVWPTFRNPETGADEPVPHKGCGRSFRLAKGRDVIHKANFSDPVRYPYGCLSAIVPMHLRKVS